ncbi:drug/metabolite transporter (DMT)-like permease [Mesorhizobium robiniae]|uniref:Drug/metabolite transporter (DMT)-like permease n=1 Tax=Mesorhizobium robiniae TaxID=559315 RepID=A0ABV2GZ50_9HYPH|nr:DMT family transporter [Mesorhizobium sp. ZC-5]MCV3243969.1 DMT family transporter [Mesorhizobium sp. ZC-5]
MHKNSLAATGFLCLGVFIFSLQDAIMKGLSDTYSVTQAITVRSIVALPILVVLVRATGSIRFLLSKRAGLLTIRAVILLGAYLCYYLSIAALPLADAIALYVVAPLIIAGLGILFLGERPHQTTFMALVVGLIGVIITLEPGLAAFEWASALTLLAAALYSSAQILARKLGDSESAAVITFYQNLAFLIGAPVLAALVSSSALKDAGHPSLAFLMRPWVWPTLNDTLLMAGCGVIASAGMTLLAQAYRLAPAGNVAVFEYSAILWVPLWGFLFFDEVPRFTTVVGAALICGAGLFALIGQSSAKNAAQPT